jgi:transposase
VSRQSYFPSEALLGLRQLTRFRARLVNQVGSLKQQCLSVLGIVFPEYPQLFSDNFSVTALALLAEAPLPGHIAQMDVDRLEGLVRQKSRGRLGAAKARQIHQAATQSCGLRQALDAFELQIRLLLEQLRHLEGQIGQVDQQIEQVLEQQARQATGPSSRPTFRHQVALLEGITGMGPGMARQIFAELGMLEGLAGEDPPKQVVALAGLDPRLRQSGKFAGQAKMSKRGSAYLRQALMLAAFGAVFNAKDPMFAAVYERQRGRGKHHWVALSHVANKMARVVYAVLSQNRAYEPVLS